MKADLVEPDSIENRTLVENVHPADWVNPEPRGRYNLVVIGAGTAGLVCAAGAAGLGARVALVERQLLGGDCLNVGCVPSKALIRTARAAFDARSSAEFAAPGGEGARADFAAAMERLRGLRAKLSAHDSARRFRDELGVDVYLGQAFFTGPNTVQVAGKTLEFSRAALCTGARAAAPDIPGLEAVGYLTNETVFSLTELPLRLAVIGAGPLGCELAQAFARLGSRVTLLQHAPQILPREDQDAAALVAESLRRDGIELELGVRIIEAKREGGEKLLRLQGGSGIRELAVDAILAGVGRAPNLEGLGLEAAGIRYDKSGVQVSDTLMTSNPRVYAAGDICSVHKFTHTADAQARIVIANALFGGRQRSSRLTIPWCTYTDPEIAHVGYYEKEALEKGLEVATLTVPLSEVDRAVLDGESAGFARVHLKKGTDTILGATVVARHAGEMIGELTLAITSGLGLAAIGKTIHPYPTQAEAVRKLADAYQRTRLTPLVKRLLSAWLAWQR